MCKKIGLLGGSFNPAHQGHVDISQTAYKTLALDEVWWLVARQNPLKDSQLYAPYGERLDYAKHICKKTNIIVKDYENTYQTTYSFEIIEILQKKYANFQFIWIMGADSFISLPKWKNWQNICDKIHLAIFDRPGYNKRVESCEAAKVLNEYRCHENDQNMIFNKKPPCWIHLPMKPNMLSSTHIREQRKENDHNN